MLVIIPYKPTDGTSCSRVPKPIHPCAAYRQVTSCTAFTAPLPASLPAQTGCVHFAPLSRRGVCHWLANATSSCCSSRSLPAHLHCTPRCALVLPLPPPASALTPATIIITRRSRSRGCESNSCRGSPHCTSPFSSIHCQCACLPTNLVADTREPWGRREGWRLGRQDVGVVSLRRPRFLERSWAQLQRRRHERSTLRCCSSCWLCSWCWCWCRCWCCWFF